MSVWIKTICECCKKEPAAIIASTMDQGGNPASLIRCRMCRWECANNQKKTCKRLGK